MADILYTGKGLATKLPSDDGRAMSRLSDFIVKAETIKYEAFKDNKDWFLKTQEVDPVAFLTTANQDYQTRLMKKYNEDSAAVVKEAGGFGKLSGEAQSKILAGKNYLISEQNKMRAEMDQYLLEKEVIAKDKGATYDPIEFYEQKQAPYLDGNPYDTTPLRPRAKSIIPELIRLKGKIGIGTSVTGPTKGVPGYQETTETIGTRDEIAPIIIDAVFRDEGYKRDMLEKWNALPEEEKNKYLETDGVAGISEAERSAGVTPARGDTNVAENPILKFYIDTNYKHGVKEGLKGRPTRISTDTGDFSIYTKGGKKTNYVPSTARETLVGDTEYKTFHDIGNLPAEDITTGQNIRILNKGGDKVEQPQTPITAEIVGYDEYTDEFIFIATKNWKNFGEYGGAQGKDVRFAVKRSELGDKYDDLEIIKDGNKVKIGSIVSTPQAEQGETLAERLKRLKENK